MDEGLITESAKMAIGKGVIQGYTGVAAVDRKHQIIVDAQAHGTGSEKALLIPVVTAAAIAHHGDVHHGRCRVSQRREARTTRHHAGDGPHCGQRPATSRRTVCDAESAERGPRECHGQYRAPITSHDHTSFSGFPRSSLAVRQSHDLHIGQSSIAALSCRAVKQMRDLASVAEVSGTGKFERHSITGAPVSRAPAAPSLPLLPP